MSSRSYASSSHLKCGGYLSRETLSFLIIGVVCFLPLLSFTFLALSGCKEQKAKSINYILNTDLLCSLI